MKKNAASQKASSVVLYSGYPLTVRQKQKAPEQVSSLFALLMLTCFSLMIGTNTYYAITEFKYQCFLVLTILFFVAMLFVGITFLLNRKQREERLLGGRAKLTLPQILLAAFFLAAALSSLLSPYHYDVWQGMGRYEGLLSLLFYCSIFVLLSFWGEFTEKYIYGLALSMILFCAIGIPQFFGANPFSFYFTDGAYYSTYRFFSTIGQRDIVSGLIALAVPTIACGYLLLEGKWRRWLCLPAFALLLYVQIVIDIDSGKVGLAFAALVLLPILLTSGKRAGRLCFLGGIAALVAAFSRLFPLTIENENYSMRFAASRMGLLLLAAALVLGVLAFLLLREKLRITLSPKKLRIIILVILVVLIAAALLFLYSYEGGNQLLTEISEVLHGTLSDSAGSGRGYIWKSTLNMIGDHPLLGSGPDTFLNRFEPYLPGYQAVMNEEVQVDFAHNDFLQIAVNYGLIGLSLYIAFLVSLCVRTLRVIDRNPLVIPFAAAVAGYLAHSFFSFSIAIVSPLFWIMAGLLDHCIRQTVPAVAADTKAAACPTQAPQKKKESDTN